jgi:hypothetical protein
MTPDLKKLEDIAKLMTKYQLEAVKFNADGTFSKISKKVHSIPQAKPKDKKPFEVEQPVNWTDEDVLFYSSGGAPKRSLEDIDRFASNIPSSNKE